MGLFDAIGEKIKESMKRAGETVIKARANAERKKGNTKKAKKLDKDASDFRRKADEGDKQRAMIGGSSKKTQSAGAQEFTRRANTQPLRSGDRTTSPQNGFLNSLRNFIAPVGQNIEKFGRNQITKVAMPLSAGGIESIGKLMQGNYGQETIQSVRRGVPDMYRNLTTGPQVGIRDVGREMIPTFIGGGVKAAQTFAPAQSKFIETSGKLLGERAAYDIYPQVREQYEKGNLDILPTVSKETIGSLGKKTAGAMIEASIYKMVPSTLKRDLISRFGIGYGQGWGFAIADGMANDRSLDEIMENGKSYAKYGAVGEVLAPYIGKILSSGVGKGKFTETLKGLPKMAGEDITKTGETIVGKYLQKNPPGLSIVGETGLNYKNIKNKFVGAEGKTLGEISDKDGKILIDLDRLWKNYNHPIKLKDVLDHPELYKNYPQLKDNWVKFDPDKMGAVFNRKTGDITVGLGEAANGNQSFKEVILHEVTHTIQEIEGLYRGGNPEMFLKKPSFRKEIVGKKIAEITNTPYGKRVPKAEIMEAQKMAIKLARGEEISEAEARKIIGEGDLLKHYKEIVGEQYAENVARRSQMGEKALANKPFMDRIKPGLAYKGNAGSIESFKTPKSQPLQGGVNLSKADDFFRSPESPAPKISRTGTGTLLEQPSSTQAGKSSFLEDVSYTKSEAQVEKKVNEALKKSEVKRIFKKTGVAPEFTNVQKPSKKIMVAGEGGVVQTSERNIGGAMNKVERGTFMKKLGDKFNDISPTAKGFKDVYRNMEKFFGDKYEAVKKSVIEPFEKGKSQMFDNITSLSDELNEKIVKKMGFQKGSPKSADLQKFGEGLLSKEEVVKKYGKDSLGDFMHANNWFRKQYDTLLDEVNAVRARIYPNDPTKIIPKRKDYYRHFQEMQDGLGGLANIFESPAGIQPTLAGVSQFTKPKSKWLSFAQKRLGAKTEYDATGGFLNYIRSAEYAKNVDPHINKFRNLGTFVQEASQKSGKDYNNMIEFLEDYAGDLAGKTNPLDRGIQKYIPGGRKSFQVLDWLNKRTKANVILANASSSLAQSANIPQGIASAGEKNFGKGLVRLAKGLISDTTEMAKSSFIKERYFKALDKFDVGILKSTKKFSVWMVQALDELGTKSIWNGHYEKALAENIPNPINYADDMTRKLVAGRGIGEVPIAQKSKVFQLIAPFQLEVANQWHVIGDMAGKKEIGKLMKFAVYSYLFNRAYKGIRGSDVSFDPINAIVEGVQAYQEEDDKKIGAMKLGGRVAGEVLSNVPLGQTAAATYPEYGIKIGDKQYPTRKELFGEGDPTRFGSGLLVQRGLQDPLYKLLPGFGGQQIKRTKEGIQTLLRGYSETDKGEVRFPVERNIENIVKAPLFGEYATDEGKDYLDKERKPLSEDQSKDYLKGEKGYQEILDKRDKDRIHQEELDKLKEEVRADGKQRNLGDTTVFMEDGEVKTTQSKYKLEAESKYEELKNLSDKDFMLKREELSKIGDKEIEIAKQIGALRRNETTKQMGLEFEGDWSRSDFPVQDKANVVMKKMDSLSDDDKTKFFSELEARDVMTDDLKKEMANQFYDKMGGTLEEKTETIKKYGSDLRASIVKRMFDDINALKFEEKYDEATAITDKLNDDDWETYKKTRASWYGNNTKQLEEYMNLNGDKAVEFLRSLYKKEQDRIIEGMTNDEWSTYQKMKVEYDGKKEIDKVNAEQSFNQGMDEAKKMGFTGQEAVDYAQRQRDFALREGEIQQGDQQIASIDQSKADKVAQMQSQGIETPSVQTASTSFPQLQGTARTDRNNNPTAMTTDVAKSMGLVEGVDYVNTGDAFPDNPKLFTAKLLGDPVETTIKGIDKGGFYTSKGKPRWTYIAMSDEEWRAKSHEDKVATIAEMYAREGGNNDLKNLQYAQVPMTSEEKKLVQSVATGKVSEADARKVVVEHYMDIAKNGESPVEATTTEIPTASNQEITRTKMWLMTQQQGNAGWNIYSTILQMRNFVPYYEAQQQEQYRMDETTSPVNNSPFLSALSNSMNRYYQNV